MANCYRDSPPQVGFVRPAARWLRRVRPCSPDRGSDISDRSIEIVSVPLQLRECLRGILLRIARVSMVEKMGLPDDCGTPLVGSDQERQNRAAEGFIVVSHDRPPSCPCRARCAAPRG